jgi:hypothetical protein
MTLQRRGARPEALVFGGAFWLVGVPAVALPFIYLLAPLGFMFGDCLSGCESVNRVAALGAIRTELLWFAWALAATFLGLVGLLYVAHRRPSVGYPLIGGLGAAILIVAFGFAILQGEPLLVLIVLSWPGWSGIAFVTAAMRSRRPRPLDRTIGR